MSGDNRTSMVASVNVATYDPRDVRFTINGIECQGYMDGTWIEVLPDPMPPVHVSGDGTVTLTLLAEGGDLRDLWDFIATMPVPDHVRIDRERLFKMIRRALRDARRRRRMKLRARRGRGATSA